MNISQNSQPSWNMPMTLGPQIQNPYIRNKLRSYNVQNLSELYGLAIKEDQKQKIRELDFGNSTPKKQ